MPYCENCGKQINPEAKFCGNCGSPLNIVHEQPNVNISPQAAQPFSTTPSLQVWGEKNPPMPTSAQTDSENILGAVFLRKPKSLGRWDSYSGVITSKRLIFAQMTSKMIQDATKLARDQAKAEGKGFFSQWADQLKASFNYSQRYLSMEPSVILSETPGNFEVVNNTISEIKLKLIKKGNAEIQEFEIEFVSSMGKHKFDMDQRDENVKLLKQVYGERVKTPFGYSYGLRVGL